MLVIGPKLQLEHLRWIGKIPYLENTSNFNWLILAIYSAPFYTIPFTLSLSLLDVSAPRRQGDGVGPVFGIELDKYILQASFYRVS